jgi:1-acyl-sn-glycerol-3-phosphate acyltransferase
MERSWRVFATGLSFAVFGAGALVVNVLLISAIVLACRVPEKRQHAARACIRRSFRLFLRLIEALQIVRFDVGEETIEKLSDARGRIIVANHPTLIDVVVLLAHVEQGNCVVKQALWRNPLLSWIVSTAGYIPNTDATTVIAACDRALHQNEALIIFPEATRTVPGKPLHLQRGAAAIAVRCSAEVLLVRIGCEPVMLSKGRPWYRVPDRRPRFTVRFSGSVRAHDYLSGGQTVNAATRRLTGDLQRELSREAGFGEGAGTGAQAAIN